MKIDLRPFINFLRPAWAPCLRHGRELCVYASITVHIITHLRSSTADLADFAVVKLGLFGRLLLLGLGLLSLLVLPGRARLRRLLLLVVGRRCRVQGGVIT